MQEHSWPVHLIRYTLNGKLMTLVQQEVRPHGSLEQPPMPVRTHDAYGVLAREVLRLAQREAELLANIRAMEESAADARRLTDENESEIAALEATIATMGERDGQHLTRIADLEADLRNMDGWIARADRAESREADLAKALQERDRSLEVVAAERDIAENGRLVILHSYHMVKIARDKAEAQLVEKEHQLGLAKATIKGHVEELGRRVIRNAQLRQQLDAEQSRGRQYCLELVDRAADIEELRRELAEKAEEIRQREAERDSYKQALIESRQESDRRLALGAETESARLTLLHENRHLRAELAERREDCRVYAERQRNWMDDNERLRAATEDGIAHVERARQGLSIMGTVTPITGLSVPLEQLDLAHEALSRGAAGPRVGVDPAKPAAERTVYVAVDPAGAVGLDEVRGRLARLEIGKETAAFRWSESMNLAIMLTDHADRLKALETNTSEVRATVYQEFTGRLRTLDEAVCKALHLARGGKE